MGIAGGVVILACTGIYMVVRSAAGKSRSYSIPCPDGNSVGMHERILLFLRGAHQYDGDGECCSGGKGKSLGYVHICLWNRRSAWNICHQHCGGDSRNAVDKTDVPRHTARGSDDSDK